MKLKSLTLQNFRCFEHLEINLHPQLTVLIADNGGGKTAVLDAIRTQIGNFVELFDPDFFRSRGNLSKKSDIRHIRYVNNIIEGYSMIMDLKYETNRNYAPIESNYAEILLEKIQSGENITLPLIVYFGTSRSLQNMDLISMVKDLEMDVKEFSRTSGYFDCLSTSSNFNNFAKWFRWVYFSYRDEQLIAIEKNVKEISGNGKLFSSFMKTVQNAVDCVLKDATGWHTIEYRFSQKQLVMNHDELGDIPVTMLSDGIRNAIAMVADIAYRACKLNPHLGENAAKETDGVVLIDEVDMFLHPKWQQTIIKSLTDAFPKMQFIVTTHSPQVIRQVKPENIIILNNGKPEYSSQSFGMDSNWVLRHIMGSSDRDSVVAKKLDEIFQDIDNDNFVKAQEAVDLLRKEIGEHPELVEAEALISRYSRDSE